MPDSTLGRLKDSVARDPATARVKEELQRYLQARAEHTLTGLGDRLGSSLGSLAESGQRAGGLVGSLAKGGKALGEGKSPVHAAVVAGASHLENTVKDKLKGMFGKGRKSGGGKSKSVTIVEDIDVGVDILLGSHAHHIKHPPVGRARIGRYGFNKTSTCSGAHRSISQAWSAGLAKIRACVGSWAKGGFVPSHRSPKNTYALTLLHRRDIHTMPSTPIPCAASAQRTVFA